MNNSENYYQKKALKYGISTPRFRNIMAMTKDFDKGKTILDVGCATGYLGSFFKKNGSKVYGVDISREAVNKAKKVLDKALVVDIVTQKLPFQKNTFDIVICSEVIEHLFNPVNLMKEIYRVLKPNGLFVVTTPNILYLGHRLKFLRGEFRYEKEGPFDEGHIHFYTYTTLKEDLAKVDFKIVKENHVYRGLKFLKNNFPGLFAYQFVILAQK